MKHHIIIILSISVLLTGFGLYSYGRSLWYPLFSSLVGRRTIQDAVVRYGHMAESRLMPRFQAAGVNYPPKELSLIGLKEEKQLELWVRNDQEWRFIYSYPIKAASGLTGPKLREGDHQVPEGMYRITDLNPNSSYHLSMKLNYPNSFDLHHAEREGRAEPGSDIFIHGKAVSVGCLAMGDPVIEELFVLVHKIGKDNVQVLISPHDARKRSLFPITDDMPEWTHELYKMIEKEIGHYRDTVYNKSFNRRSNDAG